MAWSPTRASPAPCSRLLTSGPVRASRKTLSADGPPPWGRVGPSRKPPSAAGPLPGGTANRGLVIRVGDTVRRPAAPCWPATHALLAHLHSVGFDAAPRVLAAGPTTELLTYVHGRAAVHVGQQFG